MTDDLSERTGASLLDSEPWESERADYVEIERSGADQATHEAEPNADIAHKSKGPWRRLLKPGAVVTLGLLLIVGCYMAWFYHTTGRYWQSTNDAYVSVDEVPIAPKLAGYVLDVAVEDNAAVEPGQILARLDPTDYTSRYESADAQINLAKANELATLSGIGEARAAIRQAEAAIAGAEAELTFLDGELVRMRPLVEAGAEPRSALDQLVANRAKAAAELQIRKAAAVSASNRVASIRSQANVSRAQIEAAMVQRFAAQNDIDATVLVAATPGKIGSLAIREGQFVQPGQRLMTIMPVSEIFVVANFKENQIGLMRPGQRATIEVDALPGITFDGIVESISPGTGATFSLIPPQNATGNFTKIVQRVPVRIRIEAGPESRKILVPGLSLQVSVDTRPARATIDAIRREQEQNP